MYDEWQDIFRDEEEDFQEMVRVAQKARIALHQDSRHTVPSLLDLSVKKVLNSETRFCNSAGVNGFQLLPSALLQRVIYETQSQHIGLQFLKLMLNKQTLEFDLKSVPEKQWGEVWEHINKNCKQIQKIQFPENIRRKDVFEDVLKLKNLRSLTLSSFALTLQDVQRICNSLIHVQTLHIIVAQNFLSQEGHMIILQLKNLSDLELKLEFHFPHSFEEEEIVKVQAVRAKILFYEHFPRLRRCVVDALYRISDNWDDELLSTLLPKKSYHLTNVTLDHRLSDKMWPDNVQVDELHLISRYKMNANIDKIMKLQSVKRLVLEEFQPRVLDMILGCLGGNLRSLSIISYDRCCAEVLDLDLISVLNKCPLLQDFQYNGHYRLLNFSNNSKFSNLRRLAFMSANSSHMHQNSDFLRYVLKRAPHLHTLESVNLTAGDILWLKSEPKICTSLRKLSVLCPSANVDTGSATIFVSALKQFVLENPILDCIDVLYSGETTNNFLNQNAKLSQFFQQLINVKCSVKPFDPM